MPQDLREAPQPTEYAPGYIDPAVVQRSLENYDGSEINIVIELELNIQTVGDLVTVGGVTLIAPAMWALLAAQSDYGSPILPYVASSYRSYAEQAALYANRENNPLPVAPPGSSNHETGTAADIETAISNACAGSMVKFGWVRDVPSEPWHWHWTGF